MAISKQARDMRYGRRGGGWTEHDPEAFQELLASAPKCAKCHGRMLFSQRTAHAVCSTMAEAFPTKTTKAKADA